MKGIEMKNNAILDKTMDFSIRIVNLYKYLKNQKKETVMSKQLLRSGTSIRANVREAHNGQSDKDFLAKIYIAYKETSETEYWLTLLHKTDFLTEKQAKDIINDCEEIGKILTTIIKTMKKKI